MPPKKNVDEVAADAVENTVEAQPEVSNGEVSDVARKEALLDKAIALSGQIQYYNSGIHGVDGDMSYTLAVAPPAMVALRELLTILRAEIKA